MDILNELRLRRWARQNYSPIDRRSPDWDPVVLDEMQRRDDELAAEGQTLAGELRSSLVPLAPVTYFVDPPQLGPDSPHFLSRPVTEPLEEAREWGLYLG